MHYLAPDDLAAIYNLTALYNPATNTWAQGPSLPNGMGADDAPGQAPTLGG